MLIAAWTAFGIFFGTQGYIREVYGGRPASLPGYITSWLLCGYTWAILTLPILRFSRRFSLARLGWTTFVPLHLAASVLFGVVALGIYVVLFSALFGLRDRTLWQFYQSLAVTEFQSEMLVYLAVVGVATAWSRLFAEPSQVNGPAELIQEAPHTALTSTNFDNGSGHTNGYLKRLPIKDNGRISLVDVDKIEWIESYGNYLKVHTADGRHIYRETMTAIEKKLDMQRFVRIRRSAIVRVDQVVELRPNANGEYEVALKNGIKIASTRHYRKNLEALLAR